MNDVRSNHHVTPQLQPRGETYPMVCLQDGGPWLVLGSWCTRYSFLILCLTLDYGQNLWHVARTPRIARSKNMAEETWHRDSRSMQTPPPMASINWRNITQSLTRSCVLCSRLVFPISGHFIWCYQFCSACVYQIWQAFQTERLSYNWQYYLICPKYLLHEFSHIW